MNDCANFREMLSQLIDGTLDIDDAARMRTHLVHCDACRATLDEYRRIGASIRALPPVMPPVDLRESIYAATIDAGQPRLYLITNRLSYSLAAVAAVITVFLVAAYLLLGGYQRSIDPSITASRPANLQSWPIMSPIEITFNKAMDHASVRAALGIQPSGENERLTQSWDGNTLRIGLNQPLKPGSTYIVKITDAARDKWGNHLSQPFTLTFSTTPNVEAYRTPTTGITPTPTPPPARTSTAVIPTPTTLGVVPPLPTVAPSLPTSTPGPQPTQPAAGGQPTRVAPTPTSMTEENDRPATATATATPSPTATATRPAPTATSVPPTATPTTPPTATPSPTAPAPTSTAPAAKTPVTGAIGDVYWANEAVRQQIGEPVASAYSTDGRQQDFQNGTMIYRSDNGVVYILINNQLVWSARTVTATSDAAPVAGPSPDLWEPGGLFGAVWHDDASVSTDLGYALAEYSQRFTATVQMFEHGLMFATQSSVYIFYDNGGWEFWPISGG